MDLLTSHLVALFIIIPIFFKLLFKQIISTKKPTNQNLPPGPWKLPLIGNMHNLIGSMPHRGLHKLALKFGPVMHFQLGELSSVIISSPDAAKQVMQTHDIITASRPSVLAMEIISYSCTNLSFSPYGDYWRQLRKIAALELLSVKRVQSFRSLRETLCLDLARWLASQEGSSVNLTEKLSVSSYALISLTTLGKKTEVKDRLLPIINEAIELAAGFNIADVYPSIKLIQMMSGLRRRLLKLHKEADKLLDAIVHDHKVASANNNSTQTSNKEESLVDVLLRCQQDEGLDVSLTHENVKAVILEMLTGASETSPTVVDWALAEMMKNPRVMEKAQDEVRRVFDDKGYVDESKLNELEYLKSIVKETLRLHPPLPLLLPRKCSEKCEIGGYEIPVDTKIIVNAWAINRDPKYWKHADCFEPERFLDNLIDYKGTGFEYIPFGAGRRICPGMTFGLANVELQFAMLLYHFDWNLPDGMKHEEMDMTERLGVTVRRNKDLFVVPVIKRPVPSVAY